MSNHSDTHITYLHYCGHSHTYRLRSEWPEYRPCFDCSQAINFYLCSQISPHIRSKKGRAAVLGIYHAHIDQIYRLVYERRKK